MSVAEFIAAIAWPVTVLVIALLFRKPLTEALASATGRLSAGPFKLEWDRQVAELKSELGHQRTASKEEAPSAEEIEVISPAAAIVDAFGEVEAALRSALEQKGAGKLDTTNVGSLAKVALEKGVINAETANAIEGLSVLRNLAVHGGEKEVSSQRAHEFVSLAEGVLYAISAGA